MAVKKDSKPVIIIDPGSYTIRAGFAGYSTPTVSISSVIGRPKYKYPELYVGDKAQKLRGILSLRYPIRHGAIQYPNDVEIVLRHIFDDLLCVDPSEHAVLIAEPVLNSKSNKEILAKMMFENFNVPELYLAPKSILALYASGHMSGCVVYSGESVTSTVCVYEGYALSHVSQRINFGGLDVTNHLQKGLMKEGYAFTTSAEMEIVRNIKEVLCYISQDPETELTEGTVESKKYTLPDGSSFSLKEERFLIPEVLFHPQRMGRDDLGIPAMVRTSISKADMELHNTLYSNVVLAGGNTLFPGYEQRLKKELMESINEKVLNVRILAPVERKQSAWIGGSILGAVSKFTDNFITKAEYDDIGPEIIHSKCCF